MKSISLIGDVNENMCKYLCDMLGDFEQKGVKTLRIDMCSGGGDYEYGVAMANRIKNSPIKITTYNLSMVASSALMIFSAGYRRYSSKYANFMFHELLVGLSIQKLSTIKDSMAQCHLDNEIMITLLNDYSEISMDFLRERLKTKQDYYFGAEEALKLKFIHGIK